MRKLFAFASLTALLFAGSGCMSIGVQIAPPRSELGSLVNPTFTSALTAQLGKQKNNDAEPDHDGDEATRG